MKTTIGDLMYARESMRAVGTSEGAKKGWDSRGRGRKEQEKGGGKGFYRLGRDLDENEKYLVQEIMDDSNEHAWSKSDVQRWKEIGHSQEAFDHYKKRNEDEDIEPMGTETKAGYHRQHENVKNQEPFAENDEESDIYPAAWHSKSKSSGKPKGKGWTKLKGKILKDEFDVKD